MRFIRRAEIDVAKLVVAGVLMLAAAGILWWSFGAQNREKEEYMREAAQTPTPSETHELPPNTALGG